MNGDFEKHESELEREIARLGECLHVGAPAPMLIQRVQRAVAEEGRAVLRRRKRLLAWRTVLGTAAALLMLLFFAWPQRAPDRMYLMASEATFADWMAALDETDSRFEALLDTDWLTAAPGREADTGAMEGVIESLDESMQSFESIIGT